MASDASTSSDDPYHDVTAKYGEFKIPELKPIDFTNVYGAQTRTEPDYLDYDIKGRSVWEAAPYNAGVGYLTGIASGGAYGAFQGVANAPNRRRRVLINSLLNSTGKWGSKWGNKLALTGAMYTSSKAAIDLLNLERNSVVQQTGTSAIITPLLAGSVTGLLLGGSTSPMIAGRYMMIGTGISATMLAADYASRSIFGREVPIV